MATVEEKDKNNSFAFYSLMIILGLSVLYILGYLVYEMIFG